MLVNTDLSIVEGEPNVYMYMHRHRVMLYQFDDKSGTKTRYISIKVECNVEEFLYLTLFKKIRYIFRKTGNVRPLSIPIKIMN